MDAVGKGEVPDGCGDSVYTDINYEKTVGR